jgi:hypothetical protein
MSGWRKRQIQEKHMTKDEAFLMAIEALENADYHRADEAITAIKAALEAKDEPVEWKMGASGIGGMGVIVQPQRTEQEQQIETLKLCLFQMQEAAKDLVEQAKSLTPPQRTWVGLTDEEKHLFSSWLDHKTDDEVFTAIEAKLRSKNNG